MSSLINPSSIIALDENTISNIDRLIFFKNCKLLDADYSPTQLLTDLALPAALAGLSWDIKCRQPAIDASIRRFREHFRLYALHYKWHRSVLDSSDTWASYAWLPHHSTSIENFRSDVLLDYLSRDQFEKQLVKHGGNQR